MVLILVITLCLCAFLNFVGVRSYVLLDTYSGFADHFTTIGVIFVVFWTTVVGLALRLLHPLLRLSAAHLALIYAALMVATVIPTMGFGGYVIPLLAGVFYYATPENNWKYLIWDHIPEWVVPRDLQAITGLFQGIPADQPIPWGLWIKPLFLWGTFMLAFYLVSVSFITLMHHQWSRRERLVYPMTILPTGMVESLDDPAGSIFRSKLLWVGFLIAWSIPTIDVLDRLFDFQVLDGFEIPVSQRTSVPQFGTQLPHRGQSTDHRSRVSGKSERVAGRLGLPRTDELGGQPAGMGRDCKSVASRPSAIRLGAYDPPADWFSAFLGPLFPMGWSRLPAPTVASDRGRRHPGTLPALAALRRPRRLGRPAVHGWLPLCHWAFPPVEPRLSPSSSSRLLRHGAAGSSDWPRSHAGPLFTAAHSDQYFGYWTSLRPRPDGHGSKFCLGLRPPTLLHGHPSPRF